MKRISVLGALVAVASLSLTIAAYQAPQQGPPVVQVEKVKDNLFILKGGGGNTAVYVGAAGVTVVDAKNPGWGAPILENAPAFVECSLVDSIEKGDHSIFVGEVRDAGVKSQPAGRPDDVTLTLKDLGDKVFYGG